MGLNRTTTVMLLAAGAAACGTGRDVHRQQVKVWMEGPQAEVVMACTWSSASSPLEDGCLDLTAGAYEGANTWWISGFSSGRMPWQWVASPSMDTLFVACQRSRPVGMSLLDDAHPHIDQVQLFGDVVDGSPAAPEGFSGDEARELAASLCDGRMGDDGRG